MPTNRPGREKGGLRFGRWAVCLAVAFLFLGLSASFVDAQVCPAIVSSPATFVNDIACSTVGGNPTCLSTIDCTGTGSCRVTCTQPGSCDDLTINCNSASLCNVVCTVAGACQGLTVNGPDGGNLLFEASGNNAAFGATVFGGSAPTKVDVECTGNGGSTCRGLNAWVQNEPGSVGLLRCTIPNQDSCNSVLRATPASAPAGSVSEYLTVDFAPGVNSLPNIACGNVDKCNLICEAGATCLNANMNTGNLLNVNYFCLSNNCPASTLSCTPTTPGGSPRCFSSANVTGISPSCGFVNNGNTCSYPCATGASLSPSVTRSRTPSISRSRSRSPSRTRSRSSTPSRTRSATPSRTPSSNPSNPPSQTPTRTPTPSTSQPASASPSLTPSISASVSPTSSTSLSRTPSASRSNSPSNTATRSVSTSPSATPSTSISPSGSATPPPSITPSLSLTPSISQSRTPSVTRTPSRSATPSITTTPSNTASASVTPSSSLSPSGSLSLGMSASPSRSISLTPSVTRSPSNPPSSSPSVTATASSSGSPSASLTPTPSVTPTISLSRTPSNTRTPTRSVSLSRTPTSSTSTSPSATSSPSSTASPSNTASTSPSLTGSPTRTRTPSRSTTPSNTRTPSRTPSRSSSASSSLTPSATASASASATASMTATPTATRSPSTTRTQTRSVSATRTVTRTASPTQTPSASVSGSPSTTASVSVTVSVTPSNLTSPTGTRTNSPTISTTRSATRSRSATPSVSTSATASASASASPSATISTSLSQSPSPSNTRTRSPSRTQTPTRTPSRSVTRSSSPSASMTASASVSISPSNSLAPGSSTSPTRSVTASPSVSASPSTTASASATLSTTPSVTPSISITPSVTPTISITPSVSGSPSASASVSPSSSASVSMSPSASSSISISLSATPSETNTASASASASVTPTSSTSASVSLSPTASLSNGASVSTSVSTSASPSDSASISTSPSTSLSTGASVSNSPSPTSSPSTNASVSPSTSVTTSTSNTPSNSVSPSNTPSNSVTPSNTASISISPSITPTLSPPPVLDCDAPATPLQALECAYIASDRLEVSLYQLHSDIYGGFLRTASDLQGYRTFDHQGDCNPGNLAVIVPATDSTFQAALAADAYCDNTVGAYAQELCATPAACTLVEFMGIAENLTISATVLALNFTQPVYDALGPIGADVKAIVLANEASQAALKCGSILYAALHDFCSASAPSATRDWGVTAYDPISGLGNARVVRRNDDALGMSSALVEDFNRDDDHNDLVFFLGHDCIAAQDEYTSEFVVVGCNVRQAPVALGGGYEARLLLNYNGTLLPPTNTTPTEACLESSLILLPPPVSTPGNPLFDYGVPDTEALGNVGTTRFYRDPFAPQVPLGYGCDLIVMADYPDPNPQPAFCGNLADGSDLLMIEDTRDTMPVQTDGNLYINTLPGTPQVDSAFTLVTTVSFARGWVFDDLDEVQGYVQENLPRLVLENMDCKVQVELFPNDEGFVNPDGIPYGLFTESPNFAPWNVEGLPTHASAPQCVRGKDAGLFCDGTPLQCPLGFCSEFVGLCSGGLNDGQSCTVDQCPFGSECYAGSGAYPGAFDYYQCDSLGCYDPVPPGPCPGYCPTAPVAQWYLYPALPFNQTVWTFPVDRYVPPGFLP